MGQPGNSCGSRLLAKAGARGQQRKTVVPHGPPGLDHKDYIIYETCIRKRWVPRMCVPSADPKHHVNRGAETPRTRHAMRRARGRSSKAPRPPPLRRPQMCTPKHTTLKIQELAGPRCGVSYFLDTHPEPRHARTAEDPHHSPHPRYRPGHEVHAWPIERCLYADCSMLHPQIVGQQGFVTCRRRAGRAACIGPGGLHCFSRSRVRGGDRRSN